jgi:hypothetical protein
MNAHVYVWAFFCDPHPIGSPSQSTAQAFPCFSRFYTHSPKAFVIEEHTDYTNERRSELPQAALAIKEDTI